jgi:hypothetical protein
MCVCSQCGEVAVTSVRLDRNVHKAAEYLMRSSKSKWKEWFVLTQLYFYVGTANNNRFRAVALVGVERDLI